MPNDAITFRMPTKMYSTKMILTRQFLPYFASYSFSLRIPNSFDLDFSGALWGESTPCAKMYIMNTRMC